MSRLPSSWIKQLPLQTMASGCRTVADRITILMSRREVFHPQLHDQGFMSRTVTFPCVSNSHFEHIFFSLGIPCTMFYFPAHWVLRPLYPRAADCHSWHGDRTPSQRRLGSATHSSVFLSIPSLRSGKEVSNTRSQTVTVCIHPPMAKLASPSDRI